MAEKWKLKTTKGAADAFGFRFDVTGKPRKLIAFEWSGPD